MVASFALVCEVNYSRHYMKSLHTSPASASVPFGILLRYNEQETARWREWFSKQTEAVLQIPAGDPSKEMGTIRDLLFHILIVEWVYAKVLNGENWGKRMAEVRPHHDHWHLRGRGGSPA